MKIFSFLYSILFYFELVRGQVPKLSQFNVDADSLTISGASAGGSMTVQFHHAYSSEILGIGIFTGTPFGSAKGFPDMTDPVETDVDILLAKAAAHVHDGLIDNTSHMAGKKAFIYNGALDTVAPVLFATLVANIYDIYGMNVTTKFDIQQEHGFPTDYYGCPCSENAHLTQGINNCDYRGAFEMFKTLYGPDTINPELSVDFSLRTNLHEFSQTEFIPVDGRVHMDTIGYIFVPEICKHFNEAKCKIHVALHGCDSNRGVFGEIFATRTGYLETGAANDIVIIFPQTRNNREIGNPGCWDWFGINQPDGKYLTKEGWQNMAIHGMIQRVIYGGGGNISGANNIQFGSQYKLLSFVILFVLFFK